MSRFVIDNSTNGQYYFNLKAGNGEIILTSETYVYHHSCLDGVASVKENAPFDSRYERKISTSGEYYFNLKAGNGEVIGTSEMYATSYGRDNGISSVKENAPIATIVDLTKSLSV